MNKKLEEKFDLCIICNKKTDYLSSTPISLREFYIEGAGSYVKNVIKKCIKDTRRKIRI
jgi:hypothetical protein